MEGEGGGDEEEEKEGGGGGGEAALGAASVERESEGEESIGMQSKMWIIQVQYFKAELSFVSQDLNDSYPVLAPIRRPGRRQKGGDTVIIQGNQTPPLVTSGNEAEIEEDKSDDEDDTGNDEEEEENEECEGSADKQQVPPRFTKAVIWT